MSEPHNKKGPVIDPGVCRCCGATKKCRILNLEYDHQGKKEIYAEMFVECFGIILSHLDGEQLDRLICAICVSRLREAAEFRRQVLLCEEKLLQSRIMVHDDAVQQEIKIEIETPFKVEIEEHDMETHNDDNTLGIGIQSVCSEAIDEKEEKTNPMLLVSKENASTLNTEGLIMKKHLLMKMKSTKEELKNIEIRREKMKNIETKTASPNTSTSQQTKINKERDLLIFENKVTIVQNSYICPFQTSYSSFICVYCQETFDEPTKFREHTWKHEPKKLKMFKSGKAVYLDIYRIDCRLCDQNINDIDTLKTHLVEAHAKYINDVEDDILTFKLQTGPMSCTLCGKEFVFFHALKRHMAEHVGSYVCDVCGIHFFDRPTLNVHIDKKHKQVDKVSCHECGKLFKSKFNLLSHISAVHKKEAWYQCKKCDKVLFSQRERNRHLAEEHGELKKYDCETCGKVYNNMKNLRVHNRAAHLKILHKCDMCERGFVHPYKLKEHVTIAHKGERNFHCDICGKSYPRLRYLKKHIRSHDTQ